MSKAPARMVANDGAVYSFVGNAQQNGLTPFRFDSVTTPQPGQVVYVGDLGHRRGRCAWLRAVPARRRAP